MNEKDKDLLHDESEEKHDEKAESGQKHEEQKKKKQKEDLSSEVKKELEEKEGKIKSLEERLLYLQADFENFKKLKAKEKMDLLKYANETIVRELLPVIDNLELALKHAESTEDYKGIHEGVRITLNEFMKVLEKAGVTPVVAVGQKFDPNFHEAFTRRSTRTWSPTRWSRSSRRVTFSTTGS